MKFWEIGLVAVSLGCDAFAVGMGVGTRCGAPRQVFRLSFHFGLFQFMMPLVGWSLGRQFLLWSERFGPWIAFGLLFTIGIKMVYEGVIPRQEETECADPTRGLSLVVLSIATSMDALGVGFSLGIIGHNLFFAALCIGITAGAMTWLSMKIGHSLSEKFAQRMEILGGSILLVIAFKLLYI